ncbi:hypothetical protein [Paenibacillus beijingensis]|uniref:Uncharacterized protein n=1 Tax=Paenibacillus beijingensis TaxID=1126833 RepID=A0A0D5NEL0_9BACL|nr:hypothetical protein [Paenibacillus beijingensis]AJY73814.1 hypothetical protein VN24_03165 [Paenibacillus beijingensis]
MEPILPLHEERIQQFCGNMVCVVLKDGRRHIGVLSSCKNGRVHLNDFPDSPKTHHLPTIAQSEPVKPGKKKTRKPKTKSGSVSTELSDAQTKAYAPYGPGFRPYPYRYPYYPFGAFVAFELAAIAFLLLIL